MNRVKKLVGGILAIILCVSVSAQTKLPPGWQSSYVKITPRFSRTVPRCPSLSGCIRDTSSIAS